MLTPAQYKLLDSWNNTKKDYPTNVCIHQLVEQQTQRTPDAPALTFDGQTLSYAELDSAAENWSSVLVGAGVLPGNLVGVCVERSFEMIIGLLAILKTGAAYIPFDPGYPSQRLTYMMDDSAVSVLLTHSRLLNQLPARPRMVFCLDTPPDLTETTSKGSSKPVSSAESIAYIIYTSGSTGKPKGAINSHRAVVNRLLWMRDALELDHHDVFLQKTPFSFDVSVWELFLPLVIGARLVIARPDGHKDPDYLLETMAREQVSIVHFVPSMLKLFLEARGLDRARSLDTVVCSGEALPRDLEEQFFRSLSSNLFNLYGPTEAAVDVTWWHCLPNDSHPTVPIGQPVANTHIYILNETGQRIAPGEVGELYIGGIQVGLGYLNQPDLSNEKFIPDPFWQGGGGRMYRTGDLARYAADGAIEYLGRTDFQVKIRGFRIELGEIESALRETSDVKDCAVVVNQDQFGEPRLVAYIVSVQGRNFLPNEIRAYLFARLPEYMVPALYVPLASLPLNANGKLDRKALPAPLHERPASAQHYVEPRTEIHRQITTLWADLLMLDKVGIEDNFFDLGGTSLLALRVVSAMGEKLGTEIPVVRLYQSPTPVLLAQSLEAPPDTRNWIEQIDERATHQRIGRTSQDPLSDGVAVIGMAGRFPGAASIEQLWSNLCNGVESITFFTPEELDPSVEDYLRNDPDYILARGFIEDADKFDAAFFGITPREAAVMDPQQRIFLELAWCALENAGYTSERFPGLIGVYAGVGDNHYYPINLLSNPEELRIVGNLALEYGNEKDYIATRTSYHLNLTGPSVSASTGCSTSLLSVDNAFHALVNYECDMALAGGVDVGVPQKRGFLFQEGGVFARDGHCRPFDAGATGTLFNDGAGVVVLRRLADALSAGDTIYAVIRGSAKNNDGARKASFLAPSVEGQATVVALAQSRANIHPDTISYIEAHGTGTPIGDPIEVEALCRAFRARTEKTQFCWLGSIKGNIGHPTIASGVAGFIKACLALYHEKIPPTLNYEKPNPRIDFPSTPFKMVDRLQPFPRGNKPRRAGVSSFGFGGTNVHTILEEAPATIRGSGASRSWKLLPVSAKSPQALVRSSTNLRDFLEANPATNLSDAASVLQRGRAPFAHRSFIVAKTVQDACNELQSPSPGFSGKRICEARNPEVVFMFPGQGAQYINMGRSLYDDEPVFRSILDECVAILEPHLGCDLRSFLFPRAGDEDSAALSLTDTFYTQPAIFSLEYSLAKLWEHWGIRPSLMIGHSIGEFTAACLAGVFELSDVLGLVAARGRLMRGLPQGSMMSVRAESTGIEHRLPGTCSIAAINGPRLCVIAGPVDAIEDFGKVLISEGIACQLLHTSHAFHSPMMDPIIEPFLELVSKVPLREPKLPMMSTLRGEPMRTEDIMDPNYWAAHMRSTVRFSQGISHVLQVPGRVLLELGPRQTLSVLARQHTGSTAAAAITSALGDTAGTDAEWRASLTAVGQLWLAGVDINWDTFNDTGNRLQIPLPTYPFERTRHWLEPRARPAEQVSPMQSPTGFNHQSAPKEIEMAADAIGASSPEDDLIKQLKKTFGAISGVDYTGIGTETTFFELGLDSLLLTQISRAILAEYSVRIAFRDLVERYTTFGTLAGQISTQIPAPSLGRTVPTIVSVTEACSRTGNSAGPKLDPKEALQKLINDCRQAGITVPSEIAMMAGGNQTKQEARVDHPSKTQKAAGYTIPPVPGARLGRDQEGNPAWFIPDSDRPGKFLKIKT